MKEGQETKQASSTSDSTKKEGSIFYNIIEGSVAIIEGPEQNLTSKYGKKGSRTLFKEESGQQVHFGSKEEDAKREMSRIDLLVNSDKKKQNNHTIVNNYLSTKHGISSQVRQGYKGL